MISVVGWLIIALVFAATSMGLLYPCYRVARRSFPDSRQIWWLYGVATALCSVVLWYLLPLIIHQFFRRIPG